MTNPPVSNPPSIELLRRARAGDNNALDRLFQRYLPSLHRWAHGRIPRWARNSVDTADVVQETVLQTIRNLGSFEPQREGALLGYLRRSLLNRIRDRFRYAARHPAPSELTDTSADVGASPLELAINEEDRRRYEQALTQLMPSDREAIVGPHRTRVQLRATRTHSEETHARRCPSRCSSGSSPTQRRDAL